MKRVLYWNRNLGVRGERLPLSEATYFHEVKRGVSEGCEKHGFALFFRWGEERFLPGEFDALLAALPVARPASQRSLRAFEDRLPVVHLTVPSPWPDGHYVGTDERASMQRLVEHLHKEGRRRFFFLSVSGSPWALLRREAFEAALRSRGLPVETTGPLAPPHWPPDGRAAVAFRRFFARSSRPDAVICESDLLAAPFAEQALQRGLRIPEDLAVAGFDDAELQVAGKGAHFLTTIRQDYRGLGRAAVELASELIATASPGRGRKVLLPGVLVRRESTLGVGRLEKDFREHVALLLERHLDENDLLRILAGRVEVQPRSFLLRFRRLFGEGFPRHVARLRIARAAERLSRGEGNVQEIFERSGFGTRQRFTACFQEHAGASPGSFLRKR